MKDENKKNQVKCYNNNKPKEFKTSESSVSRIIKALNIKNKTQKPKEKLNQRQKDNRILFCKNLLKNELYSFPFVFTDESMIALDPIKKKKK